MNKTKLEKVKEQLSSKQIIQWIVSIKFIIFKGINSTKIFFNKIPKI